jgi:predicted metal-dependent enzyme (double-stranded beta helix superfamily)
MPRNRGDFRRAPVILDVVVSASPTACSTAAFRRLVEGVRATVQRDDDPTRIGPAVAALLQPCLGADDFLDAEALEPDPSGYRQHILHVEPDGSFSVVALVWLPGQATAVHDHVSWCVVGVHLGEEHETVYELRGGAADPHLVVAGYSRNATRSVATLLPPGDIHLVANGGNSLAVSVHVYGADINALGSSIRRRYNLEVRSAD